MTDEQKQKLRFFLNPIDGIEKTEEMIDALEYFEENKINEKVATYLSWVENKLEAVSNDRNNIFEIANRTQNENFYLKMTILGETFLFLLYMILKN